MTNVPVWESFMAPSLQLLTDGEIWRARDIREAAADSLNVSAEARSELIPSGQARYANRSNWALSYLARAGAVERPMRGSYRITSSGRQLLADHPDGIVERDLRELEEYDAFLNRSGDNSEEESGDQEPILDPTEQVEQGITRINAEVGADLLTRLHGREPEFFEQAVLDLLIAMGYGGAQGRATRTQLVNDGGIDGIIDQDALGLSRIYVQAKRYAPDNAVGRPELQAFVGALSGKADGGLFITTGRYASGAVRYADEVPTRLILIDGQRLASLMIRYGVGVQVKQTHQIVEVDEDFFE